MLRRLILVLAMLLAGPVGAKADTVTIDGVTVNSYCVLLLIDMVGSPSAEDKAYSDAGYVPLDYCQDIHWKWKYSACRAKLCAGGTERLGEYFLDQIDVTSRVAVFVSSYSTGGNGVFSSVAGIAFGQRAVGDAIIPVLERRWFRGGGDRCDGGISGPRGHGDRVILSISATHLDMMQAALGDNRLPDFVNAYSCSMCCAMEIQQHIDPSTGDETERYYRFESYFLNSAVSKTIPWRRCFLDLLRSEGVLEEMRRSQGASPTYSPTDLRALGDRFLLACQ